MSKAMSKLLTYWSLLVLLQIYGLLIYHYGETVGFDAYVNPLSIILTTLIVIGLLVAILRYTHAKAIPFENDTETAG